MSRIINLDDFYQAHPQVMNIYQDGTMLNSLGGGSSNQGTGNTSLMALFGNSGSFGEYTGACLGFYPPSTGDGVHIINAIDGTSGDTIISSVVLLGTFQGNFPFFPEVAVNFASPVSVTPSAQWICYATGTSDHLYNYGGQILSVPSPGVYRSYLVYSSIFPQIGDRISILHNVGPMSGSVSETYLDSITPVAPQPFGQIADLTFNPSVTASYPDGIMAYATGSSFDGSTGSPSFDVFAESNWRSGRSQIRF